MNEKVAGVVILYNPQAEVIGNIYTYVHVLDKLYVVDNSEKVNEGLVSELRNIPQVVYLKNQENMGIALPLNRCLQMAYEEGYCWLWTMDQDSCFETNMAQKLWRNLLKIIDSKVALYAPFCITKKTVFIETNKVEDVKSVITSGSLVNVTIAQQLGGFDEALFIDEVDHEFCYRVRKNGYKILLDKSIPMVHSIGNISRVSILGGLARCTCTHHNYIRRYYITRNKLYVASLYPEYRKQYCREILKDAWYILLAEKDKYRKFKSTLLGIFDYKRQTLGKKEFHF